MLLLGLLIFILVINTILSHGMVLWPVVGGHFVGSLLVDSLAVLAIIVDCFHVICWWRRCFHPIGKYHQ